jgi:hypothetical protein
MTVKRIIIADLDNTLADTNAVLAVRGFDISKYPAEVPAGIFEDGGIFSAAKPIRSIVQMLRIIQRQYKAEVVYLTARPKELLEVTQEWLNKFDLPEGKVVFTNDKSKGDWIKAFLLLGYKIEALIEDSPYEIESIRTFISPETLLYVPVWSYNAHLKEVRFLSRLETLFQEAKKKHLFAKKAN